jgi:chromosome segregation ATPase
MAEGKEIGIDIATLINVRDNLKKEVEKLQIEASNLQAQKHTEEVAKESQQKLEKLDVQKQVLGEEQRINNLKSELDSRTTAVIQQEERLRERLADLEKREMELVDIDKKRAELNQERANFNMYKYNIERELDQAKITIADANVCQEKLDAERFTIDGRDKHLKEQEKWWNDRIGELEEKEKQVKIEVQHLEGLKAQSLSFKKEVVNAG